MKEYISKDDLMNIIDIEPFMLSAPYLIGLIKAQPTVTEAKICREFLNKLAIKYPKSLLELWETIDSMLAEMEEQ